MSARTRFTALPLALAILLTACAGPGGVDSARVAKVK